MSRGFDPCARSLPTPFQNSFNRVEKADVPNELKTRLQDVSKLVQELVKTFRRMSRKSRAQSRYADHPGHGKKTDGRWDEVSAEGLIEEAKAVADFAKPVATAVQAVLALLA